MQSSKGKVIHHVTKIPRKWFVELTASFCKGGMEKKKKSVLNGWKNWHALLGFYYEHMLQVLIRQKSAMHLVSCLSLSKRYFFPNKHFFWLQEIICK